MKVWLFLGGVFGLWLGLGGQELKAPPRCTGPECAERLRMEERTPRRRLQRRVQTRVDRYGYPRHRMRAERYRFSPPSPRHKAIERAEAFTPYAPSVRHLRRAERQRLQAVRRPHRILLRAEKHRPPTATPKHPLRAERFTPSSPTRKHRTLARAERQRILGLGPSHKQLSERYQPPTKRFRHQPQAAEKWVFPLPPLRHRNYAEGYEPPLLRSRHRPQAAEKWVFLLPGLRHRNYAERHRYQPLSPRHKSYPEKWAYQAPTPKHKSSAERFVLRLPIGRHRPAPQGEIYALRRPQHRPANQSPCAPSPLSHHTQEWSERLSCMLPILRHSQRYQAAGCERPSLSHPQKYQRAACEAPSIAHAQKHQRLGCQPPPLRHPQAYQRASCEAPPLRHRPPYDYDVVCDAQRRGVMTQTQRFAYDLRYLFTNHRKHCEVQSAYSGVSIGEWVNTKAYGRVPVVAYKMGWRIYRFAHFYDKKGKLLKKPRIEKRKVWALYQIQVLVPEATKGKAKKRRYVKGLAGIEGFAGMEDAVLVPKWLSPDETKAIQIEKLVRKRQIAWLVRVYPEEMVRLPEWLRKYAGPKPEHLWPAVDYRLLEIWQ